MAALPVDVLISDVFGSLKSFLQKAASLDIFEGLLFDYKMKSVTFSPEVVSNFLDVIQVFTDQLQGIHQKFVIQNEQNIAVENIGMAIDNKNEMDDSEVEPGLFSEALKNTSQEETNNDSDFVMPDELELPENEEFEDTGVKTRKRRSCTKNNKFDSYTTRRTRYETRNIKSMKETAEAMTCCEWQCMLCSRVFSKRSRLTIHMTKVHNQDVGEGEECPASFPTCDSVDEEDDIELDKASVNLYCCCDCFSSFKTIQELTDHVCCRDELEELTEPPKQGVDRLIRSWDLLRSLKSFICGQCFEEYRSLQRMSHHLQKCQTGPYICELCSASFLNKRELNYHKKKKHSDVKSFFCEECGLAFKLRASLQKHLVRIHEQAQTVHSCDDCGLVFKKRIHLTNHRAKEHELEKNFLCQVCGNKFCTQGSLSAHLETHTTQPKFQCTYCSMNFHRKEKFIFHTRIHTGERPFTCTICNKSFIRKTKLDEHMRRHRGEKPFACKLCNKKYAAAWDLRHHMRKIHPSNNESEKEESCTNQPEGLEVEVDVSKLTSTLEVIPNMSHSPVTDVRETTSMILPTVIQEAKSVIPTLIPPKLEMIEVGPPVPEATIIGVESLHLSTLEGVPTASYIQLPASSQLQIQVPISVPQSFDLNTHQGQQILLTSLANFDVTTVSNLQF